MLDTFGLFHDQYPAVFSLFVFTFGTLVGSFLNVVILRLPMILEQTWQEEAALILDQVLKVGAASHIMGPKIRLPLLLLDHPSL